MTIYLLALLSFFACNNSSRQNVAEKKELKEQRPKLDPPPEYLTLDYLMGKFDPQRHKDFATIPLQYASKEGMLLRVETIKAFGEMYEAAQADGITLKIISATRPFHSQKRIWEAKWNGKRKVSGQDLSTWPDKKKRALEILKYSSMPGSSRHHWGTDLDLNALEPSYFESGKGLKIYSWLNENAYKFGFCQPYSKKGADRPYGYNEEHWHWSYMPIAEVLTAYAEANLKDEMLSGFAGSEVAPEVEMVKKFVLGIAPRCRD